MQISSDTKVWSKNCLIFFVKLPTVHCSSSKLGHFSVGMGWCQILKINTMPIVDIIYSKCCDIDNNLLVRLIWDGEHSSWTKQAFRLLQLSDITLLASETSCSFETDRTGTPGTPRCFLDSKWVGSITAGTTRELLDFVKARKQAYWGHMRKQGNCLEKEIMQGTMPLINSR